MTSKNKNRVYFPSIILLCLISVFLFSPDKQLRGSKNLVVGPSAPIVFPDGPVKVKAVSLINYCQGEFTGTISIRGQKQSIKQTLLKIINNEVFIADKVFKKSLVCDNLINVSQDVLQINNFQNKTKFTLSHAEIFKISSDTNLEVIAHTNLYKNSALRASIGEIFIKLLLIIIVIWTIGQIFSFKSLLRNSFGILPLPIFVLFLWAFWGPSIYDEGWVLATGKSFGDLGWFSNVYSNSGAPMPLGNTFNYLTFLITESPNSLLLTRTIWLIISAVSLIQMLLLLNLFKNLSKLVYISHLMIYVSYVIAFGGGWRPELLVLLLLNSLLIHLYISNKFNNVFVGILVGIGLATAQSGIILLVPLVLFFHKNKTSKHQILFTSIFSLSVFLCVSLSFANMQEFVNGINEFRNSSVHKSIPFFGEILRYTPFVFGIQPLIITIAFIALSISVTSVALSRFVEKKAYNFFQIILPFSLLLLSLTPSKWTWHLLPLAPLVVLNTMQLTKKLDFRQKSILSELILIGSTLLILNVAFKSLGENEAIAASYPFKSIEYSVPWISTIAFFALILLWRIFVQQNELAETAQVQKYFWESRKIWPSLSIILLTGILLLPILENYLLSDDKVSNVFERRKESQCQTFADLKTLEITSSDISKRQQKFTGLGYGSMSPTTIELNKPTTAPGHEVFFFSIKAKSGAIVSLRDASNIPQSVIDLTLPSRTWTSYSNSDKVLEKYFDSRDFEFEGIYIYPSPSSQIVSFSTKSELSNNLIMKVNSPGEFSISGIDSANLIELSSVADRSPTFVIPPLVSNFSCVSNKQFNNAHLMTNLQIIQDESLWFRPPFNHTFKNLIDNLNSSVIPIYGTEKSGLYSVLQIEPFVIQPQ